MPEKNPFAPSSGLAFLTGLTTSTMDAFKQEHERQIKEDEARKQIDYQLLMDALKMRVQTGNITPTEMNEILTRSVDIFKPKGHGGIKEKLGELFGRGKPHEMQSGKILGEAKPKADVKVEGGTEPSTFEGGVTLPPPPDMTWKEPTLRQQELRDRLDIIEGQTEKVLAVEERRQVFKRQEREAQNRAILERFKEQQGIRDDAKATQKLRERASFFGDPDEPMNQERARISLQEELNTRTQLAQSRIEVNKKRLVQIDAGIEAARARIEIARANLGKSKAANWDKDPQVRGAWAKVNQYRDIAKSLRTQAAIAYSQDNLEEAERLQEEAEKYETVMQGVINNIQNQIEWLSGEQRGGVRLPNPPSKSGAKLTEAEIRAAGGTDADVAEARRKGVLAP